MQITNPDTAEWATIQTAEIHSKVPSDWILPFVHQRYDDLSVLGNPDRDGD